jgi:phosphoribosylamine---glycine ligase
MKVLVVGSGGREHALVWKLKQSRLVKNIFVAPGNPGIALMATCVNIKADNIKALSDFAHKNQVDLTVVGPEKALTMGIVDEFNRQKLRIFGPSKKAAEIEGSKSFSKEFMRKYHIPTAPFQVFNDATEAISFINSSAMPIVIKASGLAAGKGAIVAKTHEEAIETIESILVKKVFGEAGAEIVIETFLEGQEVSIMCFTDGKTIKMMLPSQDHKQIGEGDTGPNTGGMGAYCPVRFIDDSTLDFIRDHIMEPAVAGLKTEGRTYKGILYAGLMLTETGPKILEFNCRFGDPETQAILPLLNTDLADIFIAIVDGNLSALKNLSWSEGAASCVVLASRGYPEKPETGKRIFGLKNYTNRQCHLFHAGTRREGKNWLTAGGRVVGVTGFDKDLRSALNRTYEIIDNINFDGMVFRSDIGFKANMRWKKEGII